MNGRVGFAYFMLMYLAGFLMDLSQQQLVNLTVLQSAVSSGAVCLDGSPPAYNFDRGFDSGANKWIVFLEGGAWCESVLACTERSTDQLGSSTKMDEVAQFGGILSNSKQINPYFYNWNRVFFRYCDGGSFAGEVESPISFQLPGETNPRTIYFRGQRIWKAMIKDLLQRGMSDATEAILGGDSAGGLAAMIHCNSFKDFLPTSTNVKCLSDGGFFIDINDISGQPTIHQFYSDVVELQNISKTLPKGCLKNISPVECFFPQNLVKYIKVPLFILNAAYDSWQMRNILVPSKADPTGTWNGCKSNTNNCTQEELTILQGFRDNMLELLNPIIALDNIGAFIISCFYHFMSIPTNSMSLGNYNTIWNTNASEVQTMNIAHAVGEWVKGNPIKIIDCAYPCNPNCIGIL